MHARSMVPGAVPAALLIFLMPTLSAAPSRTPDPRGGRLARPDAALDEAGRARAEGLDVPREATGDALPAGQAVQGDAQGQAAPAEAAPGAAAPVAVFPEFTHDFGEVGRGDRLGHEFVVRNEGTAPLEILTVQPT